MLQKLVIIIILTFYICKPAIEKKPDQTEKKTRLALVLGGAVSLGSFEAGAVAELLYQLENYNKESKNHKFVIDIMAGASAGSMTLAMVAKQLYQPSVLYPDSNLFKAVWVDSIDIINLISDDDSPFLLSRDRIDQLAEVVLGTGVQDPNPMQLAPEELYLGMALTRLEGEPHPISYMNKSTQVLLYDENHIFRLFENGKKIELICPDGKDSIRILNWHNIKDVAVASGTFPFAFEPKELNYSSCNDTQTDTSGSYYIDGGFFNNNPLQIARWLATETDKNLGNESEIPGLNTVDRKFLFIVPYEGRNDRQKEYKNDEKLLTFTSRIIDMVYNTARSLDYRSYINTEEENNKKMDALVHEIKTLYNTEQDVLKVEKIIEAMILFKNIGIEISDINKVKDIINSIENDIPDYDLESYASVDSMLLDRIDYLRLIAQKYSSVDTFLMDYETVINDRGIIAALISDKDNFNELSEVYEDTYWLLCEAPDIYKILYITLFDYRNIQYPKKFIMISNNDTTNLAGKQYAYFGGFLNQKIRQYDYRMGRYVAQQAIREQLGVDLKPNTEILDCQLKKWKDELPKTTLVNNEMSPRPPEKIKQFKDHIGKMKRAWLRRKMDARIVAYARQLNLNKFTALPVFEYLDFNLDNQLYRTPKIMYLGWQNNSNRVRSSNILFAVSPINAFTGNKYKQPLGFLGWAMWSLTYELFLVNDFALTDFLYHGKIIDLYYYSLGARWNIAKHNGWFRAIRVQPEFGYCFTTNKMQHDLETNEDMIPYMALTLRMFFIDLKVLQYHRKGWFKEESNLHFNFGISIAIDPLFLNRL